jgi:glycosyltransferase involved in cell wall biosynthesis
MVSALEVWALPEAAGGAPTIFRTLRAYSERGHRVTYVAPTIGANRHSPTGCLRDARPGPTLDLPGVAFERFHLPSLQESRLPLPAPIARLDQKLRFALLFPRLAAQRAGEVLERERVDVLYAYEVHGALAARRLRARHREPTVARFQGTVMHPTLDNALLRLRKYEEVLALRLPADLYIMTDDGTQGDEVLDRFNPAAVPKMRFWRNGLDLDRLGPATHDERRARRAELGLPGDAFMLITASRLAAWKRIDRAIASMPEVLRVVPNALLLIVGDGEERASLERQARDLDVAASVWFAGAVPQEEVVRYMHAADVFLALADLSNVGNPLLEAMTCGLAAVAVDAGDTRHLVIDGETGMLLPSGDPALAARAIITLASEPATRQRTAEGARGYAEEHFWSWEQRLDAEVEEVERLVGDTAGARAEPAAARRD